MKVMNIEFISKNFHDNHQAKSLIKDIITNAIDEFSENKISIDKIVVTDEESHGREIEKIQIQYGETTGYTNNEGNLAVAKVITNSDKKCSIVFIDYLFAGILVEMSKFKNIDDWEPVAQLYYYLIFHELAHCHDSLHRKEIYGTRQFKRCAFSKAQIAEHYTCTILSEFAACVLSKQMMPQAAFFSELKNTIADSDCQLVALEKHKNEYLNGQAEIVDFAYRAAQTFWVILTQFSKIIGNTLDFERGFSINQIAKLANSKVDITPTLIELENILKQLWRQYPNWLPESVEPLNFVFEKMAVNIGYEFKENDEHSLLIIK